MQLLVLFLQIVKKQPQLAENTQCGALSQFLASLRSELLSVVCQDQCEDWMAEYFVAKI